VVRREGAGDWVIGLPRTAGRVCRFDPDFSFYIHCCHAD
jgi:hypothetical protein